MALSLGSALATRVYLGATEINLAYFGATQVYTSSAFSAEAQNYFDRLDTAGDTTYTAYKQPLANYIDSLVTLGGAYWDTMESAASFVGVGIQGITVPLRDGMTVPTQNNFVDPDLDQLTGLKGDGSTKYIGTGASSSNLALNDVSVSVFVTELDTTRAGYFGAFSTSGSIRLFGSATRQYGSDREQIHGNNVSAFQIVSVDSLNGMSRDNASNFNFYNGTDNTVADVSTIASGGDISLFANNGATRYANPRLATYHIGPALNLATLEGLQETLLSEVAAAKGAAAAANYFARLDTAGDTTYVPYKQPLTNYISSLVALGGAYWDDLESAASFVGVGIQGITVPLRDGMPTLTNNNFVAGDLNTLTGLKGDASTKYIDTGVSSSALALNDHSMSVFITERATAGRYISAAGYNHTIVTSGSSLYARDASPTNYLISNSTANNRLAGTSRDNSANFNWLYETSGTQTSASSSIVTAAITVFAESGGASKTSARFATYHVGPALNLATLEALQDTLITEIAAI